MISLKLRLLLTITAIMITGLIVGGSFILHNAREAVEAEITSSIELAEKLIKGTVQSGISHKNISGLPASIEHLRHVQVIVEHQYLKHSPSEQLQVDDVPVWFVSLVYPADSLPTKLIVHGRGSDGVIIAADPADEIQEVWEDVRDLLLLSLALFIASLLLIYFAIWQGLKPLAKLQSGFEDLENNRLNIRIDEHAVPELSQLHKSFNHMISVLLKTTHEKQELSRKLITLQEDERNHIARELHDEIGPYLFSIRVDNSNIKQLNSHSGGNKNEIDFRLTSIDKTVEQLQLRIRQLLKKLRPMILNDLGLEDALLDLINVFKATEPRINWILTYEIDIELSDAINVTTYRIVQECLTNIGRHAKAENATISVSAKQSERGSNYDKTHLLVVVEDDGLGLSENKNSGLGLIGIRERVQALGGKLEITSGKKANDQTGVTISIEIPINLS